MKHLLRKSAAALVAAFLFISCGKNQAVKTEMFAPMAKTMKMSARADSAMNVMQDMAFEENSSTQETLQLKFQIFQTPNHPLNPG